MKELSIGGLKVRIPIIQGGMGVGVSLSGLAVAVANEGGVGVISSAGLGLLYRNLSKDFFQASILGLKEEIRRAKDNTLGAIGVNIMYAMTNFEDMVKTTIKEKADIIFAGAGLPLDLPKFLTPNTTTKLVPIISSGKAAKIIATRWKDRYNYLPDAFVVEGPKAGGHLGFKKEQIDNSEFSLEKIMKDVLYERDKISEKYGYLIPVIAAGGIYDGDDMYNIMKLGADGVQLGSRFVTTEECDASPEFKQEYINVEKHNVNIIQSPVGMPGRAINNNFTDKISCGLKVPKACGFNCIKSCVIEKSPYCIIMALYNAYKGNMKNGYAFAGSNAYKATKIDSVKQVFKDFVAKFKMRLTIDF